jgi:hypothetical protein
MAKDGRGCEWQIKVKGETGQISCAINHNQVAVSGGWVLRRLSELFVPESASIEGFSIGPDFISNPQSESGDVLDESVRSEGATRGEVKEQV